MSESPPVLLLLRRKREQRFALALVQNSRCAKGAFYLVIALAITTLGFTSLPRSEWQVLCGVALAPELLALLELLYRIERRFDKLLQEEPDDEPEER